MAMMKPCRVGLLLESFLQEYLLATCFEEYRFSVLLFDVATYSRLFVLPICFCARGADRLAAQLPIGRIQRYERTCF